MENFNQIIILTKNQNIKSEHLVLNNCAIFIDDTHIKVNNHVYGFDYLIFTDPQLIDNFEQSNILEENGLPITNFYFQTSFENIYFTSDDLIDLAIQNIIECE